MKRISLVFVAGIFITILLSIIISGLGNKNKKEDEISKYSIKSKDILVNNKNGEQGKIKVYLTKENKIVEIPLEEYVRGVVAAEMPAEFNIEALKAQAVAVRTYALSHKLSSGLGKCNNAKGADLCDTVHCQVYMSKEDILKSWPRDKSNEYWSKITEAVSKTCGQVLKYKGELVLYPYYFSTSSGRTENAKDIFDIDEPYLVSVQSSGEESSPKYNTKMKISYNLLAEKINENYSKAKIKSNSLKNQIKIVSNTSGGSVEKIKLGNVTIKGTDFRNILGLDSSNFSFRYGSKSVEIMCKGYGHDVGMSQWGAEVMAKNGNEYSHILEHYYQGVKIEELK